MSPDLVHTERETYNFLDWMGDVGGLFDGLRYIASWLVGPLISMKLRVDLMAGIFRSQNNNKFKRKFILAGAKYRKLVKQANSRMNTQLDLRNFLKWMRYQELAVATLLNWR